MSRKSGIKQLLTYLFKDEQKLKDNNHAPLVIHKNIRSRRIDRITKEFEKNEALREYKRKDMVQAYHTVLSFNDKDREHITESMLRDITKHYMEVRGNDALYIATAHFNEAHIHIHIAESGTKFMTGKANRISKQNFQQLKVAMQTYQKEKYPSLSHSLPGHGTRSKVARTGERGNRSHKAALEEIVKSAYEKASSVAQFEAALKSAGHEPYYRNNKLTGIRYEGDQKYRLSRLGYDKEKHEELQTKEKEEAAELNELESIREDSSSRDREQESKNVDIEDEQKETEHDDLEMDDDDTR